MVTLSFGLGHVSRHVRYRVPVPRLGVHRGWSDFADHSGSTIVTDGLGSRSRFRVASGRRMAARQRRRGLRSAALRDCFRDRLQPWRSTALPDGHQSVSPRSRCCWRDGWRPPLSGASWPPGMRCIRRLSRPRHIAAGRGCFRLLGIVERLPSDDLPIVVSDFIVFNQMHHYAPEALRRRLLFLADNEFGALIIAVHLFLRECVRNPHRRTRRRPSIQSLLLPVRLWRFCATPDGGETARRGSALAGCWASRHARHPASTRSLSGIDAAWCVNEEVRHVTRPRRAHPQAGVAVDTTLRLRPSGAIQFPGSSRMGSWACARAHVASEDRAAEP